MARQSLIWTALPNGFTADRTGLRMSLMLSPRLDPQTPSGIGKLGTFFPDWEDWPQTLASAKFEISYNGAVVTVPATTLAGPNRVDASVGVADSAVWKALFEATTPVKGFKYTDLSPSVLLSYDAAVMAEGIENLYRDLARAAIDRMPRVTELIETERWRGFIGAVKALDESSVDRNTGLRDPRLQFDALRRAALTGAVALNATDTLARFQLFHTPPAASVVKQQARKDDARIDTRWREHSKTDLPKREDISETIDFHKIVAAMGSYPTLLRRLGLVVDLVLAPGGFAPGRSGEPLGQGPVSRRHASDCAHQGRRSGDSHTAVGDALRCRARCHGRQRHRRRPAHARPRALSPAAGRCRWRRPEGDELRALARPALRCGIARRSGDAT